MVQYVVLLSEREMQRKNAEVERLSKDIDKSEELTEEITTESVTDKSDIEDISEEIKEKPKKKTKTKETDSVSVQTFNRKKKNSWNCLLITAIRLEKDCYHLDKLKPCRYMKHTSS